MPIAKNQEFCQVHPISFEEVSSLQYLHQEFAILPISVSIAVATTTPSPLP